jgi:division protein CdvB (Snf7/Vps24/ESCRT-III family)
MVRFRFWKKHEEVKVLPPPPLPEKRTTERISEILMLLRIQSEKLNRTVQRLTERGKELFEGCVKASQEQDTARATVYANEIAQLRKMSRTLLRSQLSLEQVILRLETVKEFGDIGKILGPAANIVQQVQGELSGVVPEVAINLNRVGDMLDNLLTEVSSVSGTVVSVSAYDEEAKKILEEANEIAAQRMKSAFPELPEPYKYSENKEEGSTKKQ